MTGRLGRLAETVPGEIVFTEADHDERNALALPLNQRIGGQSRGKARPDVFHVNQFALQPAPHQPAPAIPSTSHAAW